MSLVARDVEVRRGARVTLRHMSLELHPGELVAVVGPNGAGKSTLLSVLAGEQATSMGEVRMEGRPLSSWLPRERARRLAVLPQEASLGFGFLAREVVLLGRSPHLGGGTGEDDTRVALATLDATGTRHLAERSYLTLSGGERQRVQLARVLAQLWDAPAQGPCYLLLDEPTASLDLAHQHLVLEEALRFAQSGGSVLAILHDLNLAARYAHRLAVLAGGRLVALGTPAEVLQPALISETFGVRVEVLERPGAPGPLVVPAAAAVRPR
ncbi:heme ABC transporter ATP-binding protein [Myxococcaceae bacterium JPH2]|nr:heme ABC transporter ATP-binding protein [Myxococcaceae bacterium JPH2]